MSSFRFLALALTLALAACDTAVPPDPPPPDPPPEPSCVTPLPATSGPLAGAAGRLLITSRRDGTSRLYSARPDGTDLRLVTPGRFNSYDGAWSPDADRVAFASDSLPTSAGHQIHIMNADGTGRRVLRYPNPDDQEPDPFYSLVFGSSPVWNPDGSRIAFASWGHRVGSDVYIYDLETGEATRPAPHPSDDTSPSWSPSGDTLAFRSTRGWYDNRDRAFYTSVYAVPLASNGQPIQLSPDTVSAGPPRWSASFDLVAYSAANRSAFIFDMSCAQSAPLFTAIPEPLGGVAAWSPDSEWILFLGRGSSPSEGNTGRLYAISTATSEAVRLFPDDDTISAADWSRR